MDRLNSPVFSGFRNFINLFGDEAYSNRSLVNTALFAIMRTIFKTIVGLGLALLVVQKFRGNGFFRTLFYLPCVLSCMIIGLLFTGILKQDGLLNNGLNALGMSGLAKDWLGQYGTAMFWIIFIEVWMWAGFNMFLFISGLQSIPNEIFCMKVQKWMERLFWQRFTKITFPLLAPSFTVVITLNITGGLKVFDLVYALTGGGPGFDTQVLSTYTYRAFGLGLLGKSSASSVVLSLGVALVAFALNRFLRSKEVESCIKSKHRSEIIAFLLCLLISPIFLIPIIMMVLGSFKTQGEALHMDLRLPEHFMIENYRRVLETGHILRGYKNRLIITVIGVAIIIVFGSMAGIVISRETIIK